MNYDSSIFGIQFNAKENALENDFDLLYDSGEEIVYESKKTFEHDPDGEDEINFKYKYLIRGSSFYDDYEKRDRFFYELHLVPLFESLCKEAQDKVADFVGRMDGEPDCGDILAYGYGVMFGNEEDEEATEFKNEIFNKIANVYEFPIDRTRGFYLDRYVNRIGTTGWDMLREMIQDVNAINATFERMGAK